MPVSTVPFRRWEAREPTTWVFQVFQKHNKELSLMYISHIASQEYVYRNLKGTGAHWKDTPNSHFCFNDEVYERTFENLKSWSDSYNNFDNWVNLNSIMAMSSNLETYISTIVKLALESDVGVLFGASRRIDGIEILKHGRHQPFDFEDKLVSCTKGEWDSRINAFKRIFGSAPEILIDNVSALERLRKLRNNVGHAFGRDLKESRNHDAIDISDMEKLGRKKTIKYQKLIFGISKSIDKQLLNSHIGEYQVLYFYHNLRSALKHDDSIKNRKLGNHVAVLKKKIGNFGAEPVGKQFCRELIEYYEAL